MEMDGTGVSSVVDQLFSSPAFSQRFAQTVIRNMDLYTEPYNVLPEWLSQRLGGVVVSPLFVTKYVLPSAVMLAVATALVQNRLDHGKDSEKRRNERMSRVTLLMTGLSVSYLLYTLSRMGNGVRLVTDRAMITTAALVEHMLAADQGGVVRPDTVRAMDGSLLRRLPRRVQTRLARGLQ